MGRRCVVPNCKSGHRGYEDKKITIFSVPKNDIAVWSEILGCRLNDKSCVCEKHFDSTAIKSKSVTMKDGKIIFERYFSKKSLVKGATPIPNLDEPPTKLAKIDFTLSKDTQQLDTYKVANITEGNSLVICDDNLQLITTNEIVKLTIELSNNNAFDENRLNPRYLFQQICNNEIHIKQPGPK